VQPAKACAYDASSTRSTASSSQDFDTNITTSPGWLNMVACPICGKAVKPRDINAHIDSGCDNFLDTDSPPLTQQNGAPSQKPAASQKPAVSSFFQTPAAKKAAAYPTTKVEQSPSLTFQPKSQSKGTSAPNPPPRKRSFEDIAPAIKEEVEAHTKVEEEQPAKKPKTNAFQKAARRCWGITHFLFQIVS
jgi:putative ATPase